MSIDRYSTHRPPFGPGGRRGGMFWIEPRTTVPQRTLRPSGAGADLKVWILL